MESAIYLLYKIDLNALVRNNLYLSKEYHLSWTEVMSMPFYLYEQFLMEVKLIQKEEEKERKKQEKEQNAKMPKMPGMPKIPTPSMPKVNIPHF